MQISKYENLLPDRQVGKLSLKNAKKEKPRTLGPRSTIEHGSVKITTLGGNAFALKAYVWPDVFSSLCSWNYVLFNFLLPSCGLFKYNF